MSMILTFGWLEE